jgi:2-polyprenyl-3-methyl-5-hydroxy-6-metoxy-1,4-benzoquinol methylase
MTNETRQVQALAQAEGKSSARIYGWVGELLAQATGGARGPILDLGCGAGGLVRALASQGWREIQACDGFDYARELRALGATFCQADLNGTLPYADQSFAVVAAVELIEHLENPRRLIREIHRVLRPGGIAVVTTPNLESFTSLLSLVLRGYPSAFSDGNYPAHITPVLEIDLRRMFREAGFVSPRASWSGWGRIPGTPWHWQALSGRGGGRRVSDNYALWAARGD